MVFTDKNIFLILFAIFFSGCVTNTKLFSNVYTSTDKTYGYTKTNPISFTNGDLKQSTDALFYYLKHLRTANDKKLIPVMQFSINNPDYNPNKFSIKRVFGDPTDLKERFLDLYLLKVENEADTIKLFFNLGKKDTVRAPIGLKFIQEIN